MENFGEFGKIALICQNVPQQDYLQWRIYWNNGT